MRGLLELPNHGLFEGRQAESTSILSSSFSPPGRAQSPRQVQGALGRSELFAPGQRDANHTCSWELVGVGHELRKRAPFAGAAVFSTSVFRFSI